MNERQRIILMLSESERQIFVTLGGVLPAGMKERRERWHKPPTRADLREQEDKWSAMHEKSRKRDARGTWRPSIKNAA
jgi:hypothetical protein